MRVRAFRRLARARRLVGARDRGARRVADVWPQLGLGEEPAGLLYAVNKSTPTARPQLADGDEVALIPPVSGGAFRLSESRSTSRPSSPRCSATRPARSRRSSARRASTRAGAPSHYLDYEAYEGMAEQVMAELAEELTAQHELCEVAIHHRVGRVEHRRDVAS